MVKKKLITSKQSSSLFSSSDGYRLRFMMVRMFYPMTSSGDTDAICLYSDYIGGALCGGIKHNGTSAKAYGSWVPGGAFKVAAESGGIDLPNAVDQSTEWYATNADGSPIDFPKGTFENQFWSVEKLLPTEDIDGNYKNDYRLSPQVKEVTSYVFIKRAYSGGASYIYDKGITLRL